MRIKVCRKILDTYPIKLKTVDKMKVKYVQGKKLKSFDSENKK